MDGRACFLLGLLLVLDAPAMVIQQLYIVDQREIPHAYAGSGIRVHHIGQGQGSPSSPPRMRVGVDGDGERIVQPFTSSRNCMHSIIIGPGGLLALMVDYHKSGTYHESVPRFTFKSAHTGHADSWHVGSLNHGCFRLLPPVRRGRHPAHQAHILPHVRNVVSDGVICGRP